MGYGTDGDTVYSAEGVAFLFVHTNVKYLCFSYLIEQTLLVDVLQEQHHLLPLPNIVAVLCISLYYVYIKSVQPM